MNSTNTPKKVPVTTSNALFHFYDIESLSNVFSLCIYEPHNNTVQVFYLIEPDSDLYTEYTSNFSATDAGKKIIASNPALKAVNENGQERCINFYDLSNEGYNETLATMMGLSDAENVNDPMSKSTFPSKFRLTCDTDPNYDPINEHPYIAGYNSTIYDTTILACYFNEAFSHFGPDKDKKKTARDEHNGVPSNPFTPTKPSIIRAYNDVLFSEQYKEYMPKFLTDGEIAKGKGWKSIPHLIRMAMINSGRYLDVARLNERQQRQGLKRVMGMLGHQILESDKLGSDSVITTLDEFYELLAYNVSDTVYLEKTMHDVTYAGAFDLKKALLDEYPETIYENIKGEQKPDIRPSRVRKNRLTPDSSSAKFVAFVLSPYGQLNDIEAVSYQYPHPRVAKEKGIQSVDVLEECDKFFKSNISDPDARAQWQDIYDYYASIRGKNFNDSDHYKEIYSTTDSGESRQPLRAYELAKIPKKPNNLPYFDADGKPTSCFATFSTGGIHGAEADIESYTEKMQAYTELESMFNEVMKIYPDPMDMRKAKEVTLSDGRVIPWKDVLTSTTTLSNAEYKHFHRKKPTLFTDKADGSNKLHYKYAMTSIAQANHEDFTSYYPNLLTNMSAFYNPALGEDRYVKIFHDKEEYGRQMKEPDISDADRDRLKMLRNGTKLILNTASGAGDASHKTNIRMNNTIISMRIIGQLFSWRIGQAQTLAGAKIISTNTDGLYSVLDPTINNAVLAKESAAINIEIEPEEMLLVSKDSNNRLEIQPTGSWPWDSRIIGASGGSLACFNGPNPEKSLAHPAIMDHILAEYLRLLAGGLHPLSITEPFCFDVGQMIVKRVIESFDPVDAALMFQNIVAASRGSITYPFAHDVELDSDGNVIIRDDVQADGQPDPSNFVNPKALQHYNRVFVVKPSTPGAVHLRAAGAWKVTAAMKGTRANDSGDERIVHKTAVKILEEHGLTTHGDNGTTSLPVDQDIVTRKINGIDPTWPMVIFNADMHNTPTEVLTQLLDSLDLDIYVHMAAESYEKNWRNT